MQRVAIVDPTEHSRESLRTLLLGVDFVWLEAECARYEYFFDVIQRSRCRTSPSSSLDADKAKALQMIGQLVGRTPEAADPDHQQRPPGPAAVAATRGQVLPDCTRSASKTCSSALRRALGDDPTAGGDAVDPAGQHVELVRGKSGPSQVIAVLGSRGGVGTTTLAVNLAATLASDPNNAVALVDLDLALGDADIALEVTRDGEHLDRGPGPEHRAAGHELPHAGRWSSTKARDSRSSGTRSRSQDIGVIHEAHVERILNLLKISYTHLVLDLSKTCCRPDLMALRMADTDPADGPAGTVQPAERRPADPPA